MTTRPNGVILYEGPSKLDGQPIVVIAVGLKTKSSNTKTAPWCRPISCAPT